MSSYHQQPSTCNQLLLSLIIMLCGDVWQASRYVIDIANAAKYQIYPTSRDLQFLVPHDSYIQ